MSTTPHHHDHSDDDNNEDRNDADDQRARIKNAAAQLRVPVPTIRYWRAHRRLRRAEQ